MIPQRPPSRAVMREWQDLHSAMRLLSSWVLPPDSGTIWCTSAAAVIRPSRLHISHRGCAAMNLRRMAGHAPLYLFFISGVRFGPPCKERPSNYEACLVAWREGAISAREAARRLQVAHKTFLRWAMD